MYICPFLCEMASGPINHTFLCRFFVAVATALRGVPYLDILRVDDCIAYLPVLTGVTATTVKLDTLLMGDFSARVLILSTQKIISVVVMMSKRLNVVSIMIATARLLYTG